MLSERVRPNIEAAPWVIDEIKKLEANARQFYNLTQGDPQVIIRAPSAEKRDAIIAAGAELRATLARSL